MDQCICGIKDKYLEQKHTFKIKIQIYPFSVFKNKERECILTRYSQNRMRKISQNVDYNFSYISIYVKIGFSLSFGIFAQINSVH